MPTTRFPIACLLTFAVLTFAPGCGSRLYAEAQQFPPTADLTVEPEPVLTIETLTSDKAANDHEAAVLAWGRRGWLTVGRICRWAEGMGAEGLDCPDPEP